MKTIFLFVSLLLFINVEAQNIQLIRFSPASPTSNDSLTVYADLVFTSGGCDLQSQQIFQAGNNFNVVLYHCPGLLTVICNVTDTIHLGVLSADNYYINVEVMTGTYDSLGNCTNYIPTDYLSTPLTVSLPTNINEVKYDSPIVLQINNKLIFENVNSNFTFILTDALGKIVLSRSINPNSTEIILPELKGVYFYSLIQGSKKQFTGKLFLK